MPGGLQCPSQREPNAVSAASGACDGDRREGGRLAPLRKVHTNRGTIVLGRRPLLMGVVNASPDSFSDGGARSPRDCLEQARALVAAGADMIDIGGESAVTNRLPVAPADEIARVVPVIEQVAVDLGALVSVDTYKPQVARAAVAAGASIVNDISGLRDPGLAEVCADTGAGLVVMHTRAAPKQKLLDRSYDGRIVADVSGFLRERIALALARGVAFEQLLVDPGPDFGKTPAQTVDVLRALADLHALGRPLLLAVSRKDFVGAITGQPPHRRLAGTLAAVAQGVRAGAHVLRVHDVGAVADFLAVADVLGGRADVDAGLRLADHLRWTQRAPTETLD